MTPAAHSRVWLALSAAIVVLFIAAIAIVVNQDHRSADATGPAPKIHPARIEYWKLADGWGDRVVVLVHTGCQKIARTTESHHLGSDRVAVLVSGPVDCAAYPATALTRLTLKHGGYGCRGRSTIIDAATDRPLVLAPGRTWPIFHCPAEVLSRSHGEHYTSTVEPR